jgi:hypothetical protein
MTLTELEQMSDDEVKSNFRELMQEIVVSYGDDKEDARESTEAKASNQV